MLSRDKCNVSAKGKGQACVCFLAKCQWQRNAKRNNNAGTGLLNSRALAGFFMAGGDVDERRKTMSVNPFIAVREGLGANVGDLARATGVSRMTIIQVEQGLIKRPVTYSRALQSSGLIDNANDIMKGYTAWLAELQRESLQVLKARS